VKPISVAIESSLNNIFTNNNPVVLAYFDCFIPRSSLEPNKINIVFILVMLKKCMAIFVEKVGWGIFYVRIIDDSTSGMVPTK